MIAINSASPWEHMIYGDIKFEPDRMVDMICKAMKVSFAFGYVIGQGLDVSEIDTEPIMGFLREKRTLFHFPHEKKAA